MNIITTYTRTLTHKLPHKRLTAILEHHHDVMTHHVEVLLPEVADGVLDLAGVVDDEEGVLAHLRRVVVGVRLGVQVELGQQRRVAGAGETATQHFRCNRYDKTSGQ